MPSGHSVPLGPVYKYLLLPTRVLLSLLCPSLNLQWPPHFLPLMLFKLSLVCQEAVQTEDSYFFKSFSFSPHLGERYRRNQNMCVYTCLYFLRLYTSETSFCRHILCLFLLLCIFLSQQEVVKRGRRKIGNIWWHFLSRCLENKTLSKWTTLEKIIMLAFISFTNFSFSWNASNQLLQLS